jgi:hypothetical protein
MNFKIVKILFLSALFSAVLFPTLMLRTNGHANATIANLANRPATENHPNTILIGDPVGGGVPCGDPVGGGVPHAC